jgi:hypothetical protein
MGAELVIDRSAEDYRFWKDEHTQDPKEWQRFGKKIRSLTGGEDIDIVFEHPGRETFGASVYVTRKGGVITTCASTSGYMHQYDNRYLWMNLKRIVSSHFANYRESWEANRLIAKGKIHPTLSKTYALEDTGQAAYDVHKNLHQGKVGVLCLAPEEGLGVEPRRRSSATSTSTRSTASATCDTLRASGRLRRARPDWWYYQRHDERDDGRPRAPDRRRRALGRVPARPAGLRPQAGRGPTSTASRSR